MLKIDPVTPRSIPLVSVDVTDMLPSTVTLTSATVELEVHEDSEVADATPSARLLGGAALTGNVISQFFHNGVLGAVYVMRFYPVFNDGELEPVDILIPVEKYMRK